MSVAILCRAIRTRNLVRFYYNGDKVPGERIVEPHLVAYTAADNLALSAWFLRGSSESQQTQRWREYLISEMTSVVSLSEQFAGPRPGYNPSGGKKLHNVQCAL
jgi:hypothetical protein